MAKNGTTYPEEFNYKRLINPTEKSHTPGRHSPGKSIPLNTDCQGRNPHPQARASGAAGDVSFL